MSFAPETEKLASELIQAEYLNAVVNFGEKFNSLHEGYAVLKEEIEEVRDEYTSLISNYHSLWENIKGNDEDILHTIAEMQIDVINQISELAQVGAVLMKIKNTLESKEETTEKRKVCSKDCEYINGVYGTYFCNGQKNAPCVNLGDDCYYNDRTEEPKF